MHIYSINELLKSLLGKGVIKIGQLKISPDLRIFHGEDAGRSNLQKYEGPDAAKEIVRYDDVAVYRPLKAAPNLRRGWELKLHSLEDVRLALDFFYPAALGTRFLWLQNRLKITNLRKTLGRQSGMYKITARISDSQAQDLVQNFCTNGCLRTRLWRIEGNVEEENVPLLLKEKKAKRGGEIPLLCPEACHLFVCQARRVVKNKAFVPEKVI